MAGGTRSYSLASRLVEQGHEVHMVTTDQTSAATTSSAWRETVEDGIHVHWTPVAYSNRMSNLQRIASFVRFATRSARRAKQLGGDVVFATSTPLTIALPGVYAARRNKIPMVFEVRDLWPAVPIAIGALKSGISKRLALWLERFAYRHSQRIVALAPGMKDAVATSGFPAERITVIPNGADNRIIVVPQDDANSVRSGHPWLGDRKLVLYCGALGRVNGVDYLVHVADRMRSIDPQMRFVIIGDGAMRSQIEDAARACGVLDVSLFMLGSIPKASVTQWLHAANITTALFTGPSIVWKDATQNKFFDSLAAGKPIACNFDGWQCQIAAQENVGIVLPAHDLDAAAQLLQATLNDTQWLDAAAIKAQQLAQTRFSMDEHALKLETVLTQAVSEFRKI